ncbi:MAG TPA: hypothetical protein VGU03_01120 [Frateuria sp.]|uniref:hypothetical protein n=1 Tax=Frateuria sp. TaxID=2211372 RepID=UPI002DE5EB30|nr:hypothetical protein [Frateuria sp.]
MAEKPVNWLPIFGPVTSNGSGRLSYEATADVDRNIGQPITAALIRSNKMFDSGSIRFEVKINAESTRCHVVLNEGRERPIYIGINYGPNPFGAGALVANNWEWLAGIGWGSAEIDKWIKVEIKVNGSEITSYIDDVVAFRLFEVISPAPVSFWMNGVGACEVRNIVISDNRAKAFVVMQFGDVYDSIYKEVISPLLSEFGYEAVRADEIHQIGLVIEDINSSLRQCAVVIADITPDNPNVYYEVGYAHALGKPTILMCDRARGRLPFDLSGFRTIFYENSIRGKPLVEETLRKHLEKIVRA